MPMVSVIVDCSAIVNYKYCMWVWLVGVSSFNRFMHGNGERNFGQVGSKQIQQWIRISSF